MKAKRLSKAILYLALTMMALYTLFPLAFLLINSFKAQSEIVGAPLSLPSSWDFSHLIDAAERINFWRALGITALITLISVILLVVVSSLSAWVMVRIRSWFSHVLLLMFTAAMLVPFQSVMYPLISLMETLQLKKSGGSDYYVWRFRIEPFRLSVPRLHQKRALVCGGGGRH